MTNIYTIPEACYDCTFIYSDDGEDFYRCAVYKGENLSEIDVKKEKLCDLNTVSIEDDYVKSFRF